MNAKFVAVSTHEDSHWRGHDKVCYDTQECVKSAWCQDVGDRGAKGRTRVRREGVAGEGRSPMKYANWSRVVCVLVNPNIVKKC